MNTGSVRFIISAVLVAFVAACSGANINAVKPNEFTLGETSIADIRRQFGAPRSIEDEFQNDQEVSRHLYGYASLLEAGHVPGVTPARRNVFHFHDGVLAAFKFESSFAEDPTDFDVAAADKIVKGSSTRADVEALMGPPNGQLIWPMIAQKDAIGLLYSYNHRLTGKGFYSQKVTVIVDSDGIVREVETEVKGTRQ